MLYPHKSPFGSDSDLKKIMKPLDINPKKKCILKELFIKMKIIFKNSLNT